ncbi:GD24536 [Drosophila simulans]|uniref:GD24536 n=1 Tax=Drosophila simulans TaxID=7240 RepID=B4NUA9_DROSI|nr:GD24536 [Drosophila simulans]
MAVLGSLFLLFMLDMKTLNLTRLDGLLVEPTRDLAQLELWLQAGSDHRDEENPYVQWFLQRTEIPLSIVTYQENRYWMDDPFGRRNLVLVMSLDQLLTNRGAAAPIQKAGTFFYILADQDKDLSADEQLRLEGSCRLFWSQHKVYNRFFLTRDGVWIYDPFLL